MAFKALFIAHTPDAGYEKQQVLLIQEHLIVPK